MTEASPTRAIQVRLSNVGTHPDRFNFADAAFIASHAKPGRAIFKVASVHAGTAAAHAQYDRELTWAHESMLNKRIDKKLQQRQQDASTGWRPQGKAS